MDFSKLKKLSICGVELKRLWINGIQVWKADYKNWVKYSTESDGVTIYNGGLGYKNGYRVRSGGAEGETARGTCTGFIPVKGGDVVRFSGWDMSIAENENAINVSNSKFENIGQFTGLGEYGIFAPGAAYAAYSRGSVIEEYSGVWKWVVPLSASGVTHIRVSGYTRQSSNVNYSNMIVTINEDIE